jgi:hypothetical protein
MLRSADKRALEAQMAENIIQASFPGDFMADCGIQSFIKTGPVGVEARLMNFWLSQSKIEVNWFIGLTKFC